MNKLYTYETSSASPSDSQSTSTRDRCLVAMSQLVFPNDVLNISFSISRCPDTSNYACRCIPMPPFYTARLGTFALAETSCPSTSQIYS